MVDSSRHQALRVVSLLLSHIQVTSKALGGPVPTALDHEGSPSALVEEGSSTSPETLSRIQLGIKASFLKEHFQLTSKYGVIDEFTGCISKGGIFWFY